METPLDSISIELDVHAMGSVHDETETWMHGGLVIAINRSRPYTEDEFVLPEAFYASLEGDGDFQIFSCICGVPDCAGRAKGIRVRHREGIVEWTDLDRDETWRFERARFDRDLATAREEVQLLKRFFARKGIEYGGAGYDW